MHPGKAAERTTGNSVRVERELGLTLPGKGVCETPTLEASVWAIPDALQLEQEVSFRSATKRETVNAG